MVTTQLAEPRGTAFLDRRISMFAAIVIAVSVWTVLVLLAVDDGVSSGFPWQLAVHGFSVVPAIGVYFYCQRLKHRTSAAGLMVFVAVAFFFIDTAIGFQCSPYFGIAVVAWAASAKRPFLAGTGVLALGAAIVGRVEPSSGSGVLAAASGLVILAVALWPHWGALGFRR